MKTDDLVYIQENLRTGIYRLGEYNHNRRYVRVTPLIVRYQSDPLWRKIKKPKGSWVSIEGIDRAFRLIPDVPGQIRKIIQDLDNAKVALEELL